MQEMQVAQLWRYPVKSLKGRRCNRRSLTQDGVEGDRVVHVAPVGGPLTGRTGHDLLTLSGDTGQDGVPRVNGHPWDSPEACRDRTRHGLVQMPGWSPTPRRERFDILNLLVATDGAVERFGCGRPPAAAQHRPLREFRPTSSPTLPGQALGHR